MAKLTSQVITVTAYPAICVYLTTNGPVQGAPHVLHKYYCLAYSLTYLRIDKCKSDPIR